jgi:hypothetical protein
MKPFTKHILLLKRLVLIVTIAASSGFTTVVHYCTMDVMDCCDPSPSADHRNCDLPGVPETGESVKAQFTCHTNTLVGGVSVKPAVLVKEHKSEPSRIVLATVTASLYNCLSHTSSSSHTLFSPAETPSPPSVEKYVLNASLLI